MSHSPPGRLHVITDETLQSRWSHVDLAVMASDGGADTVQFREKRDRDAAELVSIAAEIGRRLAGSATRLIVNDRIDLALELRADGVHLGPRDADPARARRLLGPGATIGATANDLATAVAAQERPVDYLGVGPVFGTASKKDPAPMLGLAGLARIVRAVRLPVIAIGNITPQQVESVLACGAHGIAVLSAVVCRSDPQARVAEFARAIERALGTRVA